MIRLGFLLLTLFLAKASLSQTLHLPKRKFDAVEGKAFAKSISDTALSVQEREKIIFQEIRHGNVPNFLRKLIPIEDRTSIENKMYKTEFFVLPDYFAIGSNDDFFYVPMTPILAQKLANLTHCLLPTKYLVDEIYRNALIKLKPQPILPSSAMTSVAVFIAHTDSIISQLKSYLTIHNQGSLTIGNKKDIIISNKIYGQPTPRVVIYGWHKLDGKPIQPVYNKYVNTWARL